jgi:hypothetical protein
MQKKIWNLVQIEKVLESKNIITIKSEPSFLSSQASKDNQTYKNTISTKINAKNPKTLSPKLNNEKNPYLCIKKTNDSLPLDEIYFHTIEMMTPDLVFTHIDLLVENQHFHRVSLTTQLDLGTDNSYGPGLKGLKGLNDLKGIDTSKDSKDSNDSNDGNDSQDSNDSKDSRNSRDRNDSNDRNDRNNENGSLRVRIYDTEYNVLADGMCQFLGNNKEVTLSLNFYTEKPAIRIEFYSFDLKSNDVYYLNKFVQESYSRDEVLNQMNHELVNTVHQGLENNSLWSYISPLNFKNANNVKKEMVMLHKQLFLLNRANLLVQCFSKKDGKDLAAILLWTLRIHNHYKDTNLNLMLTKPKDTENTDVTHLKSRKDIILANLSHLKEHIINLTNEQTNMEENVNKSMKLRSTFLSNIRLLESRDNELGTTGNFLSGSDPRKNTGNFLSGSDPRKNTGDCHGVDPSLALASASVAVEAEAITKEVGSNVTIGVSKELEEKRHILIQLKIHLMKELQKQNTCKRVSEIFMGIINELNMTKESQLGLSNLFVETIMNHKKQTINLVTTLNNDLSKIDQELARISLILDSKDSKDSKDNNYSNKIDNTEKIDEMEILKSKIQEITCFVNDTNNKIRDIKRKKDYLEIKKSTVFYSLLENLLETRLNELYSE